MSKIVGLDAGHGLKTAGKQTPDGIKEWELNDKVRDKIVELLKPYDVEFVFTDNDEGNIDEGLTSRRVMYVNKKVDAFSSIHHNAFTGSWNSATGVEVYVDKNATAKDLELANLIYKKLVEYTGLKGRGIKKANFTVINQNQIPAVLIEGGFMDSKNDHKVITSEQGQLAYAKAVAEGLIEFLSLNKKEAVQQPVKNSLNFKYKVGDKVKVSSYYVSSTDPVSKAIHKTRTGTITKVLTNGCQNPYLLDNGMCWCNDGDIREKITTKAVSYYPACNSKYSSLVDALKSIKVDTSFNNRKKIAAKNGISNYTGNAKQNTTLLQLLKKGKMIK